MTLLKRTLATAIVASFAFSVSSARAGFTGFLSSFSTDTFNYTLRFLPASLAESLVTGDLVTIFDVAPSAKITSAVINGAPAANFSVTEQSPGITPPGLVGAAGIPAQNLENVTFMYTGPAVTASTDFSATILTNGGYSGIVAGVGTGSTNMFLITTSIPNGANYQNDTLFSLAVPQTSGGTGTPEPATLGVLSLGAAALLARRRKL